MHICFLRLWLPIGFGISVYSSFSDYLFWLAYGSRLACIWQPVGMHMAASGDAYGGQWGRIWRPAGKHKAAGGIPFGHRLRKEDLQKILNVPCSVCLSILVSLAQTVQADVFG